MEEGIIEQLRKEIHDLKRRAANVSRDELVDLAERLGRKKRKASTKHPMYLSTLPNTYSLSIPNKPGKYTVISILKQLEGDVDLWDGYSEK
jgi:hypothetical protein